MNKETENKSNINIDREKKKKVRLNKDNFIKIVFHIFRQFDDQYYAGQRSNTHSAFTGTRSF